MPPTTVVDSLTDSTAVGVVAINAEATSPIPPHRIVFTIMKSLSRGGSCLRAAGIADSSRLSGSKRYLFMLLLQRCGETEF